MYAIQIERVQFARDDKRGEDGAAWYVILSPCPGDPPGEPCRHVCTTHPQKEHRYERQAFRRGGFGHRLDASPEEIASNRANVWGWDGREDAPSLTPSFLADEGRPYKLHSYLTSGQLVLCGDSTVVLEPNPVACTH